MDYSGRVFVNITKKSIEAKLIMHTKKETPFEELLFYLPQKTKIKSIYADGMIFYETAVKKNWSPFIEGDKEVCIRFPEDKKRLETTIRIHYITILDNLTQGGMNQITGDYFEVGIYAPWFPLTVNMEPSNFDIELLGNSIQFIGGYTRKTGKRWHMTTTVPSPGYPIIASYHFDECGQTIEGVDGQLRVFWTPRVNNEYIEFVTKHIQSILNLYKDKFGDVISPKLDILLTHRNSTEHGGGYCRPGLIVIPCGKNNNSSAKFNGVDKWGYMFKYLAHELAHLWWNKASTMDWNNWLNESFAEYSSLLAYKEIIDKDSYAKMIAEYGEQTRHMGPIVNCTASQEDYFNIWYMKGPYLLHQWEEALGEKRFEDIIREIHKRNIKETTEIYTLLKEDERDYLDRLIHS